MSESKIIYGNIITLDDKDTIAKAMVINDGKITFVGTHDEVQKYKTGNTLILDYGNNYIYPGFMDAHMHGSVEANELCGYVDLSEGKSKEDYIRIMKEFIDKNPGRPTYVGSDWMEQVANIDSLSSEDLDKISTTTRIYMLSEDKHIVWVNSRVISDFNLINKNHGVFTDSDSLKIVAKIQMPVDVSREGFIAWQKEAFSLGYTAVCDAAITEASPANIATRYSELVKTGIWKLRTYAVHIVDPNQENWSEQIDIAKKCAQQFNNEYFKIIGIKLFQDGVVEAHSAWMLEDYADKPGYKGEPIIKDHSLLVNIIEKANKENLLVHTHCIGDAATHFVTDALVEAQNKTGIKDARNIIAHLEAVKPEDIVKIGQNHIIACVAPTWAPKNPQYNAVEIKFLGDKRQEDLFPLKSFIDAGAITVFHSDYPGSKMLSVQQTIYRSITRANVEFGPSSVRKASEKISRKQALYCLTRNVAYSFKEEKNLGTIEVGKIANFTVCDTDFLTCAEEKIVSAKIVNTIVDGEIVY